MGVTRRATNSTRPWRGRPHSRLSTQLDLTTSNWTLLWNPIVPLMLPKTVQLPLCIIGMEFFKDVNVLFIVSGNTLRRKRNNYQRTEKLLFKTPIPSRDAGIHRLQKTPGERSNPLLDHPTNSTHPFNSPLVRHHYHPINQFPYTQAFSSTIKSVSLTSKTTSLSGQFLILLLCCIRSLTPSLPWSRNPRRTVTAGPALDSRQSPEPIKSKNNQSKS